MKAEKAVPGTARFTVESILENLWYLGNDGTLDWGDVFLRSLYVDNVVSGFSFAADDFPAKSRDELRNVLEDITLCQSICLVREKEGRHA